MTQVATNDRAVAFAHWLRGKMAKKEVSQRALGKLIDAELPERGRRQVVRHLSGQHYPSAPMRDRYAEVFGEEYAESEDDEEADLVSRLNRLARDARDLARLVVRDELREHRVSRAQSYPPVNSNAPLAPVGTGSASEASTSGG